jgi:hypothetical protein
MKQITMVLRMIAVCAVLALFAGCGGGFFADPGHGGADGAGAGKGVGTGTGTGTGTGYGPGNEEVKKPGTLPIDATYQQWADKVDEIIAYCDKRPGTKNNSIKSEVQAWKGSSAYFSSTWSFIGVSAISTINTYIGMLE